MTVGFCVNILLDILLKEPSGIELWAWHTKQLLLGEGAGVSTHSDMTEVPYKQNNASKSDLLSCNSFSH